MQRQRRSSVEHEFAGYFGQLVPKRPLRRRKNFKMRRKVVHTYSHKKRNSSLSQKNRSRNPHCRSHERLPKLTPTCASIICLSVICRQSYSCSTAVTEIVAFSYNA